jgi:hypothetical protein
MAGVWGVFVWGLVLLWLLVRVRLRARWLGLWLWLWLWLCASLVQGVPYGWRQHAVA